MGKVAEISLELKPATVQKLRHGNICRRKPRNLTFPLWNRHIQHVRNAPNIDDRAESILPTLPEAVRGPDTRINMKGARSTQSGALVKSANATDPATGNPGIAAPIDVVASVQVISNPYYPQYGKLTGAVSTLDTKTSDFEKWHCLINNFIPRARVRDNTAFVLAPPRLGQRAPALVGRSHCLHAVAGIPIC